MEGTDDYQSILWAEMDGEMLLLHSTGLHWCLDGLEQWGWREEEKAILEGL
jgi:hypothetical protein